MSDRETALAVLSRWRSVKAWARRDPATLPIASVELVGPTPVALCQLLR